MYFDFGYVMAHAEPVVYTRYLLRSIQTRDCMDSGWLSDESHKYFPTMVVGNAVGTHENS